MSHEIVARSDLSAANAGAPQAKQIVDRFHLQKNFGEALEKFFNHHKRLLKKVAQQLGGKTPSPPKTRAASSAIERERECCKFMAFEIILRENDGPIWLEITGPPEAEQIVRGMFDRK